LKINGFKNLNDVDIRFGPFTCIAGTNAVGKSNLFDAIRFLSDLAASKELVLAARSVRSEGQRSSDIRDIFYKSGEVYADRMSFEVEMIIPREAFDDLGQKAVASITTVRYHLILRYKKDEDSFLEIEREELAPITQTDAQRDLYFDAKQKWEKSVITGRRTTKFISTVVQNEEEIVRLHQDQTKGNTTNRILTKLPRMVLSTVTA